MKRYKTWERIKVGIRLFITIILLWNFSVASAQDSIVSVPPVLQDSVIVNTSLPHWIDYMEAGYYDTIPRIRQIPYVDTAEYTNLLMRYQTEEFDYDKNSPNRIGLFKKVLDRLGKLLENIFPRREYFQFADVIYKILAVAALVLFVWIMYRVLFSGKRLLTKDKKDEDVSEEVKFIEKNLLDIDLASYIDKAQKERDFALAIRYLNLLNIQVLAKRELVHWKYTKTHTELIEEIANEELKREFTQNVNIYNRVWYGKMTLDKDKYEEYATYFLNFQSKWR